MSVRIHEISKQTGIPSKDLIDLLKERGYQVSTASSGIDPISAESLIKELTEKKAAEEAAEEEKPAEAAATEASEDSAPQAPAPEPKAPPAPPPVKHFVKSVREIEQEKEEKRKQEEAESKPAEAPTPAPKAATPPPPPPAASGPAVKAPPQPGSTPAPMAPPPMAGRSAPPVSVPPSAVPKAPGTRTPPPVVGRPAPVTPPQQAPAAGTPPPANVPPPPPGGSAPQKPPAGSPPVNVPPPPVGGAESAAPSAEGADAADSGETKIISLKPPIVIKDFANAIGLKPFRLISELMEMSIFASMNSVIEEDVATKVAEKHGFLLEVRHRGEEKAPAPKKKKEEKKEDESKFLEPRPPVLCILGHVDHGKTTLMDFIRKGNVVETEAGGITQHVAAYQVEHGGQKITFLDTPGHAAFAKMRLRGAIVTDIAILVVAADDGFMPQTDEALKFAQQSGVPVIVAINKIDSKGANIDRVKTQMQERGIPPEDWGGETICVGISALKGENIDELMDMINLQAEVLELKANPKGAARGIVIESQIEVGRGSTATVIVQKGTLKVGEALVCGERYAKVRSMVDEYGKPVKSAPPSTPVRVAGWDAPTRSGTEFEAVKNERIARRMAEERAIEAKRKVAVPDEEEEPAAPMDMEAFLKSIDQAKKKVFKVVVKCDVHGSGEAIVDMLESIDSDKVDLDVINWDVGLINKNDVMMASSSGAAIIGFNVKLDNGVVALAKHHGVMIQQFSIIYEMVDRIKEFMADMLDPDMHESKLGSAQVRQVFPLAKGFVAGCIVNDGRIARNSKARLYRDGELLCESKVNTLKRFKDDVNEVRTGYECGIALDNFNGYEEGDVIECFEIEKRRASL